MFSPGMKGAFVNKKGSCIMGSWSNAHARPSGMVVNHVIDAVYMISKAFCPDDPLGLVREVFNRGLPSLPKCAGAVEEQQQKYKVWSEQGLVKLCLSEFQKATKSLRRRQALSWVASTDVKRCWIAKLFGVSYGVIATARRHARKWTPGGQIIRLSLTKAKYRLNARAVYLRKWLDANSVSDPSGKGKCNRKRLVPSHSGHEIYCEDCKRDGVKPYCRTRFYYHPFQKGITNSKCRAGLCSHCIRYGEITFDNLEELAIKICMLVKPLLEFDVKGWKKSYKKVRKYFVRGGMFQRNLRESCNNIHHCLNFALSHPDDEAFQHKCDHDHTEVTHFSLTHTLSSLIRTLH